MDEPPMTLPQIDLVSGTLLIQTWQILNHVSPDLQAHSFLARHSVSAVDSRSGLNSTGSDLAIRFGEASPTRTEVSLKA